MNAFQRRYFAWAARWYARMPPPIAAEAERIDRWLYGRSGLRFWIGLLAVMATSAIGLSMLGMRWSVAIPASISSWLLIFFVVVGAWLKADCYTTPRLLRFVLLAFGLAYAGAFTGFLVGDVSRHGGFDLENMPRVLPAAFREATPWLVLPVAVLILLTFGVAGVRRVRAEGDAVAAARAGARRHGPAARGGALDAAAAADPAAFHLQHARRDPALGQRGGPRAPSLLRALTSFLRGSTELLALERTPLSVELETLQHYLSVMQARLGDRLRHETSIGPGADARALPAGVVLTLVENAIEHGIAPSIHGGTVRVTAVGDERSWTLRVCDDGVGLARDWREGIGLRNCRERLRHVFGDEASLDLDRVDGWATATLRIAPQAAA